MLLMLSVHVFVTQDNVATGLHLMQEIFSQKALPVFKYFEDYYIDRPTQGHIKRAPRFPVSMRNVHERVADDLPRTNNYLDRWHNHMQANIGSSRVNIWKFLEVLCKE